MTDELPSGWSRAPLADVGTWGSGGTPSRSDAKAYGGDIPWLKIGDLPDGPVVSAEERITEHGLAVSAAKLLPPNTLLIAMYGSIGKLGITTEPCATNQAIAFCKPHAGLNLHYLFYLLMGERHRLLEKGQGGTQLNISQTILKDHEVSIAPSAEQKRIVSKIDELFSRIDEGERALQRVSMLVERYRQSVLKAAVTGELTRAWREKNKDTLEPGSALLARILTARREAWEKAELEKMKTKGITPANDSWKKKYQEPALPETSDLPVLRNGWVWASVDQLCAEFGNGLSKKPAHEPPGEPILRISAVRSLAVDTSDIRYYVPVDCELLDSFYARRGDLLFTRYNGSRELVGVSGVVNSVERVIHPDKLIKARPASPDLLGSDYLAVAVNCGASWRHISSCVKTSAGQHGISGSDIKRTPVPVPPTEEQRQIVDAFALADGKCAETRISCANEMRRSGAARQSVLAAAFVGKLVSQDPADEPSASLLERIAAKSGASTVVPKRGRKKKTTA
jgi:type I restriction enzyme S subunit